ncbi:MAG TPA: glycosyltransferase family A protein [Caulobacteraceae bacterium]
MSASPDSPENGHAFVVMAYGDSPFLPGCLASLHTQTEPSRIVVATSTPSPFIEASAAAASAPLIVNPGAAGIAADWNFALNATDARFITLAHQDDVYFPQFLKRSLELLAGSAGAAVSFTGYVEIGDGGSRVRSRTSLIKHALERMSLGGQTTPSPARMRAFLSFGNPLPCSSVTLDRSRLGGFAFSGDYRSNLDWDAWLRLLGEGVLFVRTPERLVGRRHNRLTATTALTREGVRRAEDLMIFRRLWPRPIADILALAYKVGYR